MEGAVTYYLRGAAQRSAAQRRAEAKQPAPAPPLPAGQFNQGTGRHGGCSNAGWPAGAAAVNCCRRSLLPPRTAAISKEIGVLRAGCLSPAAPSAPGRSPPAHPRTLPGSGAARCSLRSPRSCGWCLQGAVGAGGKAQHTYKREVPAQETARCSERAVQAPGAQERKRDAPPRSSAKTDLREGQQARPGGRLTLERLALGG